ncbi:MAG: LytTR family DNA-binding domain-containing protein [Leeuwenhoekiella sp.]
MKFLKWRYPFEPSVLMHVYLALGLGFWIFAFLYFTEPLDINELLDSEKLLFLPLYGLAGALCYLLLLPLQKWLAQAARQNWSIGNEMLMTLGYSLLGLTIVRLIYLYVVVPYEPNPYSLGYFIQAIYLPALVVVIPILLVGRWALGKFREKKLEDQKITISGTGNYESLRLHFRDLILIQSADNYVEVCYRENDSVKKQLIRNTLSSVAETLPQLQRVHRSYLVNLEHFKQWKNQSGKKLLVLTDDLEAPLSKTYLEDVKTRLNSATN